MRLIDERSGPIDLSEVPIHLGLGATAQPVEGFGWDQETLGAYIDAVTGDGADARLVMLSTTGESWTHWECHPAGEEVVICLSGKMTVIRDIEGSHDPVELGPGTAMVNPRGVWHTADIDEPGQMLTITPGIGTQHRPR